MPIWGKFCVARQHEGQGDGLVLSTEDSPGEVLNGDVIFVLPNTIVGMKVHLTAFLSPLLQQVMKETTLFPTTSASSIK